MNEEQIRQIIRDEISKKKQQVSYPLDSTSQIIIRKDLPVFTRKISGTPTTNGSLECTINGEKFYILYTTTP